RLCCRACPWSGPFPVCRSRALLVKNIPRKRTMKNFISREQVLTVLDNYQDVDGSPTPGLVVRCLRDEIEKLPSFPAPNPDELYGRNVMGQTEDEFWDAVDTQEDELLKQAHKAQT